MYETETMKKRRVALDLARKRQIAKAREVNKMFSVYDSLIAEGCTQGSAITQTSALTGIARATVACRIYKRYGNEGRQERTSVDRA